VSAIDLPVAEDTAGLGITPRRVPRWASDPDFIASIEAGHIDIDDELMGEPRG
jgi:hypothetical protein